MPFSHSLVRACRPSAIRCRGPVSFANGQWTAPASQTNYTRHRSLIRYQLQPCRHISWSATEATTSHSHSKRHEPVGYDIRQPSLHSEHVSGLARVYSLPLTTSRNPPIDVHAQILHHLPVVQKFEVKGTRALSHHEEKKEDLFGAARYNGVPRDLVDCARETSAGNVLSLPNQSRGGEKMKSLSNLENTIWNILHKLSQPSLQLLARHQLELKLLKLWLPTAHQSTAPDPAIKLANGRYRNDWPVIDARFFHNALQKSDVSCGAFRIAALWPSVTPSNAEVLFRSALAIFCYFVGARRYGEPHAKDFMNFASRLLHTAHTSQHQSRIKFLLQDRDIQHSAIAQSIDDLHGHLIIFLQMSRMTEHAPIGDVEAFALASAVEGHFVNFLGRARERGIHTSLKRGWDLARKTFDVLRKDHGLSRECDLGAMPLPSTLTRRFLYTAFELGNVKVAARLWAYMVKSKVALNEKDFTTMIHGMGKSGNAPAATRLWADMLQRGIEPDTAAWNARIQSALVGGKVADGFAMLNEFSTLAGLAAHGTNGAQSTKNTNGQQNTSVASAEPRLRPGPNTRTLNTALSALDSSSADDVAQLLLWAATLGIPYDVFTFNILLGIYRKAGDRKSFATTYNRMLARRIKPDSVTVYLLSADRQKWHTNMVDTFVEDLKLLRARGIQPTHHSYAALMRKLMQQGEVDQAQRLLQLSKLDDRNVHARLCAVMAAQLVDDEPGLAIDDMMNDINASQGGIGSDLYDAALHRLADCHDTVRVQQYFASVERLGFKLSWQALARCLRMSIDTGNNALANQFIAYTCRFVAYGSMHRGPKASRSMSKSHEDEFWQLVAEFKGLA